jgi:hypothetical protein
MEIVRTSVCAVMSPKMATPSAFSGDDLDRLLLSLDSDRTIASKKYKEIHRTLVKFFDWNSTPRAEELTDWTLNRIAAKLRTEEIQNIRTYALAVARYVLLEDSKKHWRETSIEELPSVQNSAAYPLDTEREIVESIDQQVTNACFRGCRAKLPPREDRVLLAYYGAEDEKQKVHRQRLAQTEGSTVIALRTRANRLRDKLERCVIKCIEERRRVFSAAHGRRQAEGDRDPSTMG